MVEPTVGPTLHWPGLAWDGSVGSRLEANVGALIIRIGPGGIIIMRNAHKP